MAIQLRARGLPAGLQGRLIGRVAFSDVDGPERRNTFRVIRKNENHGSLEGYLAVLYEGEAATDTAPSVSGYDSLEFLKDNYVVSIESGTGFTRVLYRPEARFNTIFATDACNSNCIMCSQPPRHVDESGLVEDHLRHLDLISNVPETFGITGGEPTLLGEGLLRILSRIKERFPNTPLLMLSNGRMYAYKDLVRKIADIDHQNFVTAIPLYASTAEVHDFIVQRRGAFDQTLKGIYNAAEQKLKVEIRVVLHKQTVPGLLELMDFIYRNLPFVDHVALMGLENMGYVKKNWDLLWIDPIDYANTLQNAVKYLWYRKIPVSLYGYPDLVVFEGSQPAFFE